MPGKRLAARWGAAMLLASIVAGAGEAGAASATMSVWKSDAWREFWRSDRAPSRWPAPDSTVAGSLSWRTLAPGLEWATLRIACGAPAWRIRLIVARLDPRAVRLSLVMDVTQADMRPAWSLDKAPEDALLAVNAGQFASAMPWGWVFIEGRQILRPGSGPLVSAVAIDAEGRLRWSHGDTLATTAGVVTGFQSYPTLLAGDGLVPAALGISGVGVNRTHHDARLALGETRDGRILIAMTRFDAVGDVGEALPLGPTTPEMAAIMGAIGARDAVMLDGGISAQMLLRDPGSHDIMRWSGLRRVPLALIARHRPPENDSESSPSAR